MERIILLDSYHNLRVIIFYFFYNVKIILRDLQQQALFVYPSNFQMNNCVQLKTDIYRFIIGFLWN